MCTIWKSRGRIFIAPLGNVAMHDYCYRCKPLSGSGTRHRSYLIVPTVSTFSYDRHAIAKRIKAASTFFPRRSRSKEKERNKEKKKKKRGIGEICRTDERERDPGGRASAFGWLKSRRQAKPVRVNVLSRLKSEADENGGGGGREKRKTGKKGNQCVKTESAGSL